MHSCFPGLMGEFDAKAHSIIKGACLSKTYAGLSDWNCRRAHFVSLSDICWGELVSNKPEFDGYIVPGGEFVSIK